MYVLHQHCQDQEQLNAESPPQQLNDLDDIRSRALSVDAQTTTATALPRVSYLQPPYAAAHHDTGLRMGKNYNPRTQEKSPITRK